MKVNSKAMQSTVTEFYDFQMVNNLEEYSSKTWLKVKDIFWQLEMWTSMGFGAKII